MRPSLEAPSPDLKPGQIKKKGSKGPEPSTASKEGFEGLGTALDKARDFHIKKVPLNVILPLGELVLVRGIENVNSIFFFFLEPDLDIFKDKTEQYYKKKERLDRDFDLGPRLKVVKDKVVHEIESRLGAMVQILR